MWNINNGDLVQNPRVESGVITSVKVRAESSLDEEGLQNTACHVCSQLYGRNPAGAGLKTTLFTSTIHMPNMMAGLPLTLYKYLLDKDTQQELM